MKIAIVVPIVGNFGRKGFYHSQEIGLGKELKKNNCDVTVIKCIPFKLAKKPLIEKYEGITVKYIPTRAIGPHGLLKLSIIDKNTDVVFAFSDTQLIITNLHRYCIKNNIKFIPYVGIAHSFQRNLKSKLMDLIFKFTTLRVYKKVKVITKTNDAKQELMKMGITDCLVAPVGLDFKLLKSDFEKQDRDKLRKKWGFSSNDTIVSFVGRLQTEKCPIELLDIFKRTNLFNKKLLIVGDGLLREELEKKIIIDGLQNKVVVIPQVKYEDMWEIHYIADYFINLRKDEIFGMAIMEAIYYKSYTVAVSAPGPETILKDMKSHAICNSLQEVSEVIDLIKPNSKHLSNDQMQLIRNFGWDNCVKTIISIVK